MKIVRLPLDAQDQAKIQKNFEFYPYVKPINGTISTLAFIIVIYIFGFSGWEVVEKVIFGTLALLVGVMVFFVTGSLLKEFANIQADKKAGEKEVIMGIINQKESSSLVSEQRSYFFYIDSEKFSIPNEFYSEFKERDVIALHRTPLAQFVLKIELLH